MCFVPHLGDLHGIESEQQLAQVFRDNLHNQILFLDRSDAAKRDEKETINIVVTSVQQMTSHVVHVELVRHELEAERGHEHAPLTDCSSCCVLLACVLVQVLTCNSCEYV